MNIEQYVRATKHRIHSAVPVDEIIPIELRHLFNLISTGLFTEPFAIFPICSSNIFPETINLNEKSYLLWDSMFWEFFDTYMICAACFEKHYNNPELVENATVVLHNMYIEFLSYKLEKYPEISFCLANDIIPHNKQLLIEKLASTLDNRFNLNDYAGVWFQARFFVFFHEMFHVFYRENPEKYREVVTAIQTLCKLILEEDIQQYLHDTNDLDEDSKEIERSAFVSIIEETNTTFLEEIACDFQSFILLQSIIEPQYKDIYNINDIKKIIKDIQESMRLCLTFQTEITYILSVWKEKIELGEKELFSQKQNLFDVEKEVSEFQKKIDGHKIIAFTRNAVFFQIVQANCIRKYQTFSKLDDILSNLDVRRLLFPISQDLIGHDYMMEKIIRGFSFQVDSALTPHQQIEARDMLISLNKKWLLFSDTSK